MCVPAAGKDGSTQLRLDKSFGSCPRFCRRLAHLLVGAKSAENRLGVRLDFTPSLHHVTLSCSKEKKSPQSRVREPLLVFILSVFPFQLNFFTSSGKSC